MDATFRIMTAAGRGAIAVVRVRGGDALAVADAVFRPQRGRSLGRTPIGRLRLGRAGAGLGDEVVAVRLDDPMPTVEIQCHGGPAAVAAVAEALVSAGAIRAVNADGGPEIGGGLRARAMEDLASAPTLRAAEILLDQAQGALDRALRDLIDDARRGEAPLEVPGLIARLDGLIRSAEVGTRLVTGWTVVIAGRPNVGKSQLFNALAGFERSIVDPRAGVTRDVVSVRTAFGGWPVELSDTAGEREGVDVVERLGIDRARRERVDADLVVLVVDRSEPLRTVDRRLLASASAAIVVANKADLPPAWSAGEIADGQAEVHIVSATTGEGLDRLAQAIASRLVPVPPDPGAGVPSRPEQRRALEDARTALLAGDFEGFHGAVAGLLGDSSG